MTGQRSGQPTGRGFTDMSTCWENRSPDPPTSTTTTLLWPPQYWWLEPEGPALVLELLWLLIDSIGIEQSVGWAKRKKAADVDIASLWWSRRKWNLWPHYLRRLRHAENFTSWNFIPEPDGAEKHNLNTIIQWNITWSVDTSYLDLCL